MFYKTRFLNRDHATCVRFLLLAILISILVPPLLVAAGANVTAAKNEGLSRRTNSSRAPLQPFQSSVTTFVRVINFPTNDLVFNSETQKLHATVPSLAGAKGNSITDIDPFAGTIGQSVLVGSEPNKLALSADNHVLYAGLDGAAAVRRFDVVTHTPGVQFAVGSDFPFNAPNLAGDLVVSPGNSNLVAVARIRPGVSPPGGGVVVFDNGVPRSSVAGSSDVTTLAFSASEATLYGGGPFSSLQTFTVDGSGVTFSSATSFSVGADIQFQNGVVYTSSGKVVDPTTNTLLGTFPGVGSGPFVADTAAGRAYYLIPGNSAQTMTLRAFDIHTFLAVGESTIGGVLGTPTSLVRWGPNGLAFRTNGNQVFLIQTSLIPSANEVPSPTPTPSPTATPTPTPVPISVRQIELTTKDLIYNSANQTIYSSVPGSDANRGNTITPINPTNATLGTSVFIGSEPNKLALSDNGQALYVGIDGAAAVRRFDTTANTAGPQFFLGSNQFSGPLTASDLAVVPGTTTSVAVVRGGGFDSSIAVFDNGVSRPNLGNTNGNDIEFGSSATRLYAGVSFGGNGVDRLNVGPAGVTFDSSAIVGNGGKILFSNGLIYTANGSVFDPETGLLKGTFTAQGLPFSSIMTVDPVLGRAYFFSIPSGLTGLLRVFDLNTFLPLGEVTIPNIGFTQNPDGFQFSSLVRWGTNGLAFRTTTHIMLIQSPLVNPVGTVPSPTPTPTPTPSPTPEAATFVRQVDLAFNDFGISTATQKIYASLGSSVANGNSIVEINPATGAAGTPVFIGSEPTRVAISSDGNVLWTNLQGAQALRRFDIPTKTPGLQFAITNLFPSDLEVMPGSPQTVAIALSSNGPVIFDNGVQRGPATSNVRAGLLQFSSDPNILYGFNNGDTGFDFYRMTVGPGGATLAGSSKGLVGGGFAGDIRYANGRMYTSSGQVFDPDTFIPLGVFRGFNAGSNAVAIDPVLNRAFYISGEGTVMVLRTYSLDTFRLIGKATIPISGSPIKLLRWGVNGLALQFFSNGFSERKLLLIQSALVSTAAPIPTGIQLNSGNPFIFEGGNGEFEMTVTRTGDLSKTSSINYSTSNGTASEKSDYITALGTLRFAPGEASKTVTLFVTNDAFQEPDETFNFTLATPVGAELLSPAQVTVTIQDDDFTPTGTNPVDSTDFFVRQHYRDFLNRDPDLNGLLFWINEINSCGADQQCREIKRINVSAAFFQSIEFQETGYLAYRMYKVSYGDTTSPNVAGTVPIIRLREFLNDAQRIGRDVQVLVGDWQAKLEANKTEYAREFVATPRFLAAFPLTLTPAQFVQKLDQNAGSVLSATERQQLEAELAAATDVTQARGSVTRKVAENAVLKQREQNRAFVLMQYYGYLRRNPDDPQDTNFSGWKFWLDKLNQFNGNFIQAEMVKAFLSASEYRQRFGPQ